MTSGRAPAAGSRAVGARRAASSGAVRGAAIVAIGLLVVGACACGSPTTDSHTPAGASRTGVAALAAARPGRGGVTNLRSGPNPSVVAATLAVTTFRHDIGDSAATFVTAVAQLQTDLEAGDTGAAKSDELAAQADFDAFRELETGDTINASTLDETITDLGPGQSFGGLHAVERDLWASGNTSDALADASGLEAQAPVAQFLLSKVTLPPEAIGTTAVDELGWVVDVAIPGQEEQYSHLDAVDVAATVDAADQAFTAIEPLARRVSPALETTVARRFAVLEFEVAGLGNVTQLPDSAIPPATRLSLSQQVDATAAAMAQLSATLARFGIAPGTS